MSTLDLDGCEQPMDPLLVMAIQSAFRNVSLTEIPFVNVPRAWQNANLKGSARRGPRGNTKANLRMRIAKRDGARCAYCPREFIDLDDATIDHVIPNSVVGHWKTWNLVLTCAACNNLKDDKIPAVLMPFLCHLLPLLASVAGKGGTR